MSEKFNGFSQDEINKVSGVSSVKQNNNNKKPTTATTTQITNAATKQAFRGQHQGIRRMPEKWKNADAAKKQQVIKQTPSVTSSTSAVADAAEPDFSLEDVNLDRSMSKSLEEALFYQPMQKTNTNGNAEIMTNGAGTMANAAEDSSILKITLADGDITSTTKDESSILPTIATKCEAVGALAADSLRKESPFKGISLKDFESHRKMIQEQNKQKKELLYKAIEQHSQKTAAETRKIEEIKHELAKLDNDLAVDVAILRKEIDAACIHFANVEKQYIKIEVQFLRAKMDLHNAAEKKELLTEHLCTVISHNEDRKAQKLSELMHKVGLTSTDEYEAPTTTAGVEK